MGLGLPGPQACRKRTSRACPDPAAHGPGAKRHGVNHEDCVDSVVTYLEHEGLKDVVVVGHSFGGTVVQRVAQRVPGQLARLVFLDALVLDNGQCVFDNLPTEMVDTFNMLAAASSDNTMMIPWEIWRDNFMQDAPESEARSVWERLSPEPNQVNLDTLDLRGFCALATPRSFIYCVKTGLCHARIFTQRCHRDLENSS